MFTGLLDDEAHDNFATFNETEKSYRCMDSKNVKK